jgi:hypothetical protein
MAMKVRDLFKKIEEKMKELDTLSQEDIGAKGDQEPLDKVIDQESGLPDADLKISGDGNSSEIGKGKGKKEASSDNSGLSKTDLDNAGDGNTTDPTDKGQEESGEDAQNKDARKNFGSKGKKKEEDEDNDEDDIAASYKAFKSFKAAEQSPDMPKDDNLVDFKKGKDGSIEDENAEREDDKGKNADADKDDEMVDIKGRGKGKKSKNDNGEEEVEATGMDLVTGKKKDDDEDEDDKDDKDDDKKEPVAESKNDLKDSLRRLAGING